ncbi:MAG TPA: hypothetical protein VGG97_27620 [Bryobacteraceae bacterium]|jgi:hypothetical protein
MLGPERNNEQWVCKQALAPASAQKPLAKKIREIGSDVPPEVWENNAHGWRERTRPLHLWPAEAERVNTVLADTFYWIAFTRPREAAYSQARSITADIVTTEEMLGVDAKPDIAERQLV